MRLTAGLASRTRHGRRNPQALHGNFVSLLRRAKIVLRNKPFLTAQIMNAVLHAKCARWFFAPVAFLEFLEMHEGVVPGVEKEILCPRLQLDGPYVAAPR